MERMRGVYSSVEVGGERGGGAVPLGAGEAAGGFAGVAFGAGGVGRSGRSRLSSGLVTAAWRVRLLGGAAECWWTALRRADWRGICCGGEDGEGARCRRRGRWA